jgi:hypothetical protein
VIITITPENIKEWPKIYDAATDELRPATQDDVDQMQRAMRVYGSISAAVHGHSEEIQKERGYRLEWVKIPTPKP